MDGTTGATRAKRKSKKGKTVDPPPEMQPVFPMDLSMMPKMEPMDSSLHGNPFFKSEPRTQGFANYPPHSMSDDNIQSYPYLPQDFASRGFQYASRMPSGLQMVSSGTSSMNPYQCPEISTSYPYALTTRQAGFDTQDFGMQLPLTSFGPIISWEPRPSSHEGLQTVKLEGGQSSEAGTLDLGDQFGKLPIQPVDHSMGDIIEDFPQHHIQYPIQHPVQSFTNRQVNPTAHHQVQSIADHYPDHDEQQTKSSIDHHAQYPSQNVAQSPNNRHADLPSQLQAQQMADHNPHLVQQQAQEIGENRTDTPVQHQTQPMAQNPARSPVKHSVDRPAQQLVRTPIQQLVETPVRVTSQQTVQELAQSVQQPMQQHIEQPAQTPDQKLAQYPLQQPAQQPVKTPTQEAAQRPAQTIVDEQIDNPFRYTVQQPFQNPVGNPVDCRSDEPNYQPCQPTEQGLKEQRPVVQIETTQD
jgi:hypothetical protein